VLISQDLVETAMGQRIDRTAIRSTPGGASASRWPDRRMLGCG